MIEALRRLAAYVACQPVRNEEDAARAELALAVAGGSIEPLNDDAAEALLEELGA